MICWETTFFITMNEAHYSHDFLLTTTNHMSISRDNLLPNLWMKKLSLQRTREPYWIWCKSQEAPNKSSHTSNANVKISEHWDDSHIGYTYSRPPCRSFLRRKPKLRNIDTKLSMLKEEKGISYVAVELHCVYEYTSLQRVAIR